MAGCEQGSVLSEVPAVYADVQYTSFLTSTCSCDIIAAGFSNWCRFALDRVQVLVTVQISDTKDREPATSPTDVTTETSCSSGTSALIKAKSRAPHPIITGTSEVIRRQEVFMTLERGPGLAAATICTEVSAA